MTVSTRARAPGVFVLGMHRSGTSVMAGVLDRLGLDGGPPGSMFVADEFNSDGYWEQRPLVELHDRMLQRLGGFASAPPRHFTPRQLHCRLPDATERIESLVDELFDRPWFVKDPRHCLLLPLWSAALGNDDLAVVVLRSPDSVVRSLRHRNGYSTMLALGLWERYTLDLLSGVQGRPAVVVRYEDLIDDPRRTVEDLSDVVSRHTGLVTPPIDHAVELVRQRTRPAVIASEASSELSRTLEGVSTRLVGYHPRLALDATLPSQSGAARRRLAARRTMLRVAGSVVGHDAISRSQLDRRRTKGRPSLRNATSG